MCCAEATCPQVRPHGRTTSGIRGVRWCEALLARLTSVCRYSSFARASTGHGEGAMICAHTHAHAWGFTPHRGQPAEHRLPNQLKHVLLVAGPWGKLVENISGKLAFFPPRPSTYRVEEHKDGTGELYIQPQQGCVHLQCTSAWLSAAPRSLIIVSIVLQGHSARAAVLREEDPNSAYKEGRSWRRLNHCDSVCAMPLGLNTSQDHRPLLPWQCGGSGADASCVQVGAGSLSSITT